MTTINWFGNTASPGPSCLRVIFSDAAQRKAPALGSRLTMFCFVLFFSPPVVWEELTRFPSAQKKMRENSRDAWAWLFLLHILVYTFSPCLIFLLYFLMLHAQEFRMSSFLLQGMVNWDLNEVGNTWTTSREKGWEYHLRDEKRVKGGVFNKDQPCQCITNQFPKKLERQDLTGLIFKSWDLLNPVAFENPVTSEEWGILTCHECLVRAMLLESRFPAALHKVWAQVCASVWWINLLKTPHNNSCKNHGLTQPIGLQTGWWFKLLRIPCSRIVPAGKGDWLDIQERRWQVRFRSWFTRVVKLHHLQLHQGQKFMQLPMGRAARVQPDFLSFLVWCPWNKNTEYFLPVMTVITPISTGTWELVRFVNYRRKFTTGTSRGRTLLAQSPCGPLGSQAAGAFS